MSSTDRIEKTVVLKAPRSRVWHAIADVEQFAAWFGMRLDGPFVAGHALHGRIVDPPGYEHLVFDIAVERVEAGRVLAFRWHPYAVDAAVDYSQEPMTLVTFTLEDIPDGTRLMIVESGFDALPPYRRAEAFRMNDGGWEEQAGRIARHVAR